MKVRHTILRIAIAVLIILVLIVCTGWLLFPKVMPPEPTGPYQVKCEDCFYTDTSRLETYADDGSFRELPVSFWYPAGVTESRSYPLIVFSHGSFGVKESNETLYRELASHGYVVCSMDHTHHSFSTKLSSGKTVRVSGTYMKELSADSPQDKPEESLPHFEKWMELRTGDINFVLDTVIEKVSEERVSEESVSEEGGELSAYGLIDLSRICVMGHSLGGSAALGVGRQRDDIGAVIALESPFLCDIQGVDADGNYIFEQSDYPVPVLNIYSDASWDHLREWKQYAENARLLDMESDEVQNVYLSGVGHIALTDLSLSSPFLTFVLDGFKTSKEPQETLKKINEVCLGFLDEYLS